MDGRTSENRKPGNRFNEVQEGGARRGHVRVQGSVRVLYKNLLCCTCTIQQYEAVHVTATTFVGKIADRPKRASGRGGRDVRGRVCGKDWQNRLMQFPTKL